MTDQTLAVRNPLSSDDVKVFAALSKPDEKAALQLARQSKFETVDDIMDFGVDTQRRSSEISRRVLDKVKSRDLGTIGQNLDNMVRTARSLELSGLENYQAAWWKRLPILKNFLDELEKFLSSYKSVSRKIDDIVAQMQRDIHGLGEEIEQMKELDEENAEDLRELILRIRSLDINLVELRELANESRAKLDPGDMLASRKQAQLDEMVRALDNKIFDFKETAVAQYQLVPTLAQLLSADRTLRQKLTTMSTTTAGLWRTRVLVAVKALNARRIARFIEDSQKFTSDLLVETAALVRGAAVETERATQKGIFTIEAIVKATDHLEAMVDEVKQAQIEGEQARRDGEPILEQQVQRIQNAWMRQMGDGNTRTARPSRQPPRRRD